jgi:WD40 repeat protein
VASSLSVFDLESRTTREVASHGNRLRSFAIDATGTILVTGGQDGVVRVGRVSGDEPHLLYGHTGPLYEVAVSPDGRRIASCGGDGTIRLWPMPDLTKPPLHTLPHDELLAKLKSLTNLRAVRDPASDTGWKIEIGPFPGWATVPEWNP